MRKLNKDRMMLQRGSDTRYCASCASEEYSEAMTEFTAPATGRKYYLCAKCTSLQRTAQEMIKAGVQL